MTKSFYYTNEIPVLYSFTRILSPISHAISGLMLPQELKQMPFKEEIVLLNGANPIKCEKALYFNDPYFMNKLISLSPTLKLYTQGNKMPTKAELGIAMSKNELAVDI